MLVRPCPINEVHHVEQVVTFQRRRIERDVSERRDRIGFRFVLRVDRVDIEVRRPILGEHLEHRPERVRRCLHGGKRRRDVFARAVGDVGV